MLFLISATTASLENETRRLFDAVLDREPAAARQMSPALIRLLSHEDPPIRLVSMN